MTACSCHVGPGKFEGEDIATFVAWDVVLNGGADEEIGRYAFLRFPLVPTDDQRAAARDYGYCDACLDRLAAVDDHAGLCVWEDDVGFVRGVWYDTDDEWADAIRHAADEEGDDE